MFVRLDSMMKVKVVRIIANRNDGITTAIRKRLESLGEKSPDTEDAVTTSLL